MRTTKTWSISLPPKLEEESISVVKDNEADNRILECAVAARADYLVTGDKEHLLPIETFRGVRIVSPAGFLDICGE